MYNIFKNPFFDVKPEPNWAFTVEFILSEDLDIQENRVEIQGDPPKLLQDVVDKLNSTGRFGREEWMNKLGKAVVKIPLKHPEPAGTFNIFYPGYYKTYSSRYDQAHSITLTFNDNIKRDIRFILEQLMQADGLDYQTDGNTRPTLPPCFYFDMIVRVYDVERVNQYDPTDGADKVAEAATVQAYKYEFCYVSKLGAEQNTNEGNETIRTIDATITYQRMTPLREV